MSQKYSVYQVVNTLIEINNKNKIKKENDKILPPLTNLRIQKLLYFLLGLYYVSKQNILFKTNFVAWQYGPVSLETYENLKYNTDKEINSFIEINEYPTITDKDDLEFINSFYEITSKRGVWDLVELSHTHLPWIEACRTIDKVMNIEDIINNFNVIYSNN